jgi:hypothetical protein
MNELLDVEIKITKSGFIWYTPTTVKVQQVPREAYERLMEMVLGWLKEFQEPEQ